MKIFFQYHLTYYYFPVISHDKFFMKCLIQRLTVFTYIGTAWILQMKVSKAAFKKIEASNNLTGYCV